jgi:hypothetical protein
MGIEHIEKDLNKYIFKNKYNLHSLMKILSKNNLLLNIKQALKNQ